MTYLIGIDGGGTGCRVVLADMSGQVLAKSQGGPANIATSLIVARDNVLEAVGQAFDKAGLARELVANASAVLGMAGSNLGDFAAEFGRNLPFLNSYVVNDSRTTLEGAIGHAQGCIAAIGTGSVFACRDQNGVRMLGGWGFLLGDDGSGAALGRDLLRLSIRAADGIQAHSDLTLQTLLKFENSVKNIVNDTEIFTPKDFAAFAPEIVAAANSNDKNAEILMAHHTELVRASIDAAGFDAAKPFCMLGGLGPIYLKRLPQKYQASHQAPQGGALAGALAMAKHRFAQG